MRRRSRRLGLSARTGPSRMMIPAAGRDRPSGPCKTPRRVQFSPGLAGAARFCAAEPCSPPGIRNGPERVTGSAGTAAKDLVLWRSNCGTAELMNLDDLVTCDGRLY